MNKTIHFKDVMSNQSIRQTVHVNYIMDAKYKTHSDKQGRIIGNHPAHPNYISSKFPMLQK